MAGSGSSPCICSNFEPRNGRFSGCAGQVRCKVSYSIQFYYFPRGDPYISLNDLSLDFEINTIQRKNSFSPCKVITINPLKFIEGTVQNK